MYFFANTHTLSSSTVPVAVDEGIEGQSIIPAAGEVNHVDLGTEIMDIKGPACEWGMTPIVETVAPILGTIFIGLKLYFHTQIASLGF